MDLFRAIYTSQPFGYDVSMLSGILMDARRANARDGITGALICRADIYIQWLEGPEAAVRAALARIRADDRHLDVTLHVEDQVTERIFAKWSMLHDPVATWIWTPDEIGAGAVKKAAPDELISFFLKLRDLNGASASA